MNDWHHKSRPWLCPRSYLLFTFLLTALLPTYAKGDLWTLCKTFFARAGHQTHYPEVPLPLSTGISPNLVRPDISPQVEKLFNDGPNRWVDLATQPQGKHLFQRGLTGVGSDHIHGGLTGVGEAIELLSGQPSSLPRFALDLSVDQSTTYAKKVTASYSRPLTVRGKTDSIYEHYGADLVQIAKGITIDSIQSLGLFAPSRGKYFWARNYLHMQKTLVDGGMKLAPGSRGAVFAEKLATILPAKHSDFAESDPKLDKKLESLFKQFEE